VYKPGQYGFIYQILRERWEARMEEQQKKIGVGSLIKKRKFFKAGKEGGEEGIEDET
jgi:hypothetical protein